MVEEVKNGIARERIKGLEKRFDEFIDNDFKHLRGKVDWIFGTVLVMGVISIALQLFLKFR